MLKKIAQLILMILFFSAPALWAQEVIQKFLVLEMPQGDRWRLIQIDPIEQSLVDGNFRLPQAGQQVAFGKSGSATWQEKTVNQQGWLRSGQRRAFYALAVIESNEEKTVLLEGRAHNLVYVNGQLHVGNRYQYKDRFESWEPKFDFSFLPIRLKKGKNSLLFKCYRGRLKVLIHPVTSALMFNTRDVTLPDLIKGQTIDEPGAVVVINATDQVQRNLVIASDNELIVRSPVPVIQPYSIRKVPFYIRGKAPAKNGTLKIMLQLQKGGQTISRDTLTLNVVSPGEVQKHTFISEIDGSVQYFALNPAQGDDGQPKALVLSVHGANVEALNQARSYFPKKWTHIVAPTNRRPFGYDWEDWGRLDALEVLELVKRRWAIDPARIYLTGHSMGGHGTWHLGVTFPDQFGAIGPSAGWISFFTYAFRDTMPSFSPLQKMLMRASSPSRTTALAENYKQMGVYIIHGDSDRNVPVEQSRKMVKVLKKIGHRDFVYHEEHGAGHWWDNSDEPGADCVDWPPLFDFFARHARPAAQQLRQISFITASPGVSATNHWITIYSQQRPFEFSKIQIQVDPGQRRYIGQTENIQRLVIDLLALQPDQPFSVKLDNQLLDHIAWPADRKIQLEKRAGRWQLGENWTAREKNPMRYGGFKEAFNHRVLFVIGTGGSKEENEWAATKARYDAEVFWYQGNGAVDLITDQEFNPEKFKDRNIILYGNAQTNRAWKTLLADCPVQVFRNKIKLAGHTFKGSDYGILFIYPRKDSAIASVGVVGGTGIKGLRATNIQRYLYPGNGFPDFTIFKSDIHSNGLKAIKAAGFFNTNWQVDEDNMVLQ